MLDTETKDALNETIRETCKFLQNGMKMGNACVVIEGVPPMLDSITKLIIALQEKNTQ